MAMYEELFALLSPMRYGMIGALFYLQVADAAYSSAKKLFQWGFGE